MSVRVLAGLVLGALLTARGAPAGAQQFRIERDFDLVRRASDGRPLQNIYWVSLPLLPAVADVAASDASTNKCVGDFDGPPAPDGRLNADDLICAWWTARADRATSGAFTIAYYDRSSCTPVSRTGSCPGGGSARFSGIPFPLQADIGYQVLVTAPNGATYSPRNRAVITGDHDPSWTGRDIVYTPTCPTGAPNCCGAAAARFDYPSMPYHALYARADEILCGLEGVEWRDGDGDGKPDTCWDDADGDGVHDPGEAATGVFDGRTALAVSRQVNTEDVNTTVSRTATVALGRLRFSGTNFDLVPGEAYRLQLTRGHSPTLFLPPHS